MDQSEIGDWSESFTTQEGEVEDTSFLMDPVYFPPVTPGPAFSRAQLSQSVITSTPSRTSKRIPQIILKGLESTAPSSSQASTNTEKRGENFNELSKAWGAPEE